MSATPELYRSIAADDVLGAARAYLAAGLSVFPVSLSGRKDPAGAVLPHVPDPMRAGATKPSWEPYRSRFATDHEMRLWWDRPEPFGIAAVGGPISGNLAVLDIETPEAVAALDRKLTRAERDALARCPVIQTPRLGAHLYIRLAEPADGCKLARTAAGETLIEVRGQQHYVVAPGSPARCHRSGRRWVVRRLGWLEGGPWEPLDAGLWAALTVYAAELNEYSRPVAREVRGDRPASAAGDRPGDHFNARVCWSDILEPHGWRAFRAGGGVTYWTRPGKPDGVSASTGFCRGPSGRDLLYVFSTSAAPFEAEVSYSRFAAYALLNHRGDFAAATRALGRAGYGVGRTLMRGRRP